jgi:hypothetical protein
LRMDGSKSNRFFYKKRPRTARTLSSATRSGGLCPGDSTLIHPSAQRSSGVAEKSSAGTPPGLCPGDSTLIRVAEKSSAWTKSWRCGAFSQQCPPLCVEKVSFYFKNFFISFYV